MNISSFSLEVDGEPLALRISESTQRQKCALMEAVNSISKPTVLWVDLGGHPLNSSVLDEILCREFMWRVRDPDGPEVYPVLIGLHPHSEEELERGAYASKKRSSVVFVAAATEGTRLVGLPTGEVAATFEALQKAGHLTARQLADQIDVEINVAHNKLRLLHELRLAVKESAEPAKGGGRQHVYAAIVPGQNQDNGLARDEEGTDDGQRHL
jgi:hypothetical protein